MKTPPLVLASASPRRSELLKMLVDAFLILPAHVDEVAHEHLSPLEICQLNAHRKARVVAKKNPDAIVVGADTLVFLDDEILGKPGNMTEARRMLKRLQGRTHQVVTGVCLMHLRAHRERIFAISSDVLFHALNDRQIRYYLNLINPLDKAGAYGIQEHGELIIAEVSGSFSNVVGLPLEQLRAELAAWRE